MWDAGVGIRWVVEQCSEVAGSKVEDKRQLYCRCEVCEVGDTPCLGTPHTARQYNVW
jgi:hypothetical protein